MIHDELEELHGMHEATEIERLRMDAFEKDLREAIMAQLLKHYPEITDLEPQGFHDLEIIFSRVVTRFLHEVNGLVSE